MPITAPVVIPQLKPGDTLLYRAKGVFGWIISLKTWSRIGHCEVYIGDGRSVAARDGIGVDRYDLRTSELLYVLRPNQAFDLKNALARFDREWRGQGYDWLGLIRFAWRSPVSSIRFNNKQFCSEFQTRFYRAGGLDPFNGADADAIAPANFLITPVFDRFEVADDGILELQIIDEEVAGV